MLSNIRFQCLALQGRTTRMNSQKRGKEYWTQSERNKVRVVAITRSDLSKLTECFKTERECTTRKVRFAQECVVREKTILYSRCITKISQARLKQTFDNSDENEHCTLAYQRLRIRCVRRIFINLDSHISRCVRNRWRRTWCCSRGTSCYSFCYGVKNKKVLPYVFNCLIAIIALINGMTYQRDERVNSAALNWTVRPVCMPIWTKEYLTADSPAVTVITVVLNIQCQK